MDGVAAPTTPLLDRLAATGVPLPLGRGKGLATAPLWAGPDLGTLHFSGQGESHARARWEGRHAWVNARTPAVLAEYIARARDSAALATGVGAQDVGEGLACSRGVSPMGSRPPPSPAEPAPLASQRLGGAGDPRGSGPTPGAGTGGVRPPGSLQHSTDPPVAAARPQGDAHASGMPAPSASQRLGGGGDPRGSGPTPGAGTGGVRLPCSPPHSTDPPAAAARPRGDAHALGTPLHEGPTHTACTGTRTGGMHAPQTAPRRTPARASHAIEGTLPPAAAAHAEHDVVTEGDPHVPLLPDDGGAEAWLGTGHQSQFHAHDDVRALTEVRSQPCIYGCGGTLHKASGAWAVRWLCSRCRRSAVDASPSWPEGPAVTAFAFTCPIEHILHTCTIRSAHERCASTHPQAPWVAVYVCDTPIWRLPLAWALALRASLADTLGCISESVVATGIFIWCMAQWEQGDNGAPHTPICLTLEHTQAGWEVHGSDARGATFRHMAMTTFAQASRPAVVAIRPTTATATAESLQGEGAAGPAHDPEHLLLHAALAHKGYVLADAVPWLHVPAPGGCGTTHVSTDPTPLDLQRKAVNDLAGWLHSNGPRILGPHPTTYNPWPIDAYRPPALYDATVHTAPAEAMASDPRAVHPAAPLLTHRPQAPACTLQEAPWRALMKGHAQYDHLMGVVQHGVPTLRDPARTAMWAGTMIPQPPLRKPGQQDALHAFFTKEIARGRTQPVHIDQRGPRDPSALYAPDPSALWVAPSVLATKDPPTAGGPPEWRVCHDLSRHARDPTPTAPLAPHERSPNADTLLYPLQPVPMVRWGSLNQCYRAMCVLRPGVRILIAKADMKAFFRQIPLRRQDWAAFAQRFGRLFVVHTQATFGGRSVLHTATIQVTALLDLLAAVQGVHAHQYVDDTIFLMYEDEICEGIAWFEFFADFLGFERHPLKFYPPTTTLDILGVELDVVRGTARLSAHRRDKLLSLCTSILGNGASGAPVTVHTLLKWTGLCIFLVDLIPSARAHIAPIWHLIFCPHGIRLTRSPGKHERRHLTDEVLWCATWWAELGRGRGPPTTPLDVGVNPLRGLLLVTRVRTDAATSRDTGMGAVIYHHPGFFLHDTWTLAERLQHNNTLELLAIVITVCATAPLYTGRVCLLETDNLVALAALRKEGSGSFLSMALSMLLATVQEEFRFHLRIHYVRGTCNTGADGLSRGGLTISLPNAPGWDWQRWPIPLTARHLGTPECGQLLGDPSQGRILRPPPHLRTWLRTSVTGLIEAFTPTYGDSASRAQTPIPFVPYHPAWRPAMRDAGGQPAV